MKNKYDLEAQQTKYLTVKNISITDESNSYYNTINGFKIGTEVIFQAKLSSDISVSDWSELRTELECNRFYEEEQIEMTRTSEDTFYVKSSIPVDVFGDIPYTYKVYSNRTNELIAIYNGMLKIEGETPIPYFHYTVANSKTAYAHKGNISHETVGIFSSIDWKDTGIGIGTEEWKATKTGEIRSNKGIYVNEVLNNKFNSLISDSKINTQLTATNMYAKIGTTNKELYVNNVTPNNQTPESVMVGTEVTFKFTLNLSAGSASELKLKLTSDTLGLYNEELSLSSGIYSKYQKLKDIPDQWKDIAYTVDIYSNRTGEHIGTYDYILKITTPITITGYINGIRDNIELITDDVVNITAETNKYAQKAEVKFPVDVIDTRTNITIPANTYIAMDKYEENKWKVDIIIPSSVVTNETTIQVDYLATSFNQRDTAIDKLFPKVITIKITDLRIECIRDIRWREYFTYDETDADGNTVYNIPKGDSTDIHFNPDGTNTYTGNTQAVQYWDRNGDGGFDDSKESIHFGYVLEFEVDTIGLSETDSLKIAAKITDHGINGLNLTEKWKEVGMANSYYKPEVKSVDGRKITWQFKYMLPYTDINDREYDRYINNSKFITISFKPIAQRNSTTVTYFKTEDSFAEIFKYYLPETARDDIYVENRN